MFAGKGLRAVWEQIISRGSDKVKIAQYWADATFQNVKYVKCHSRETLTLSLFNSGNSEREDNTGTAFRQ